MFSFFLLRSHVWHRFCFVVPDLFARVARPTVSSRLQCMALTAVSARVEEGEASERASVFFSVSKVEKRLKERRVSERASGGRERIGRGERKGDVNLGADGRQEEKQARTVFLLCRDSTNVASKVRLLFCSNKTNTTLRQNESTS